jgi:hypothetical protein
MAFIMTTGHDEVMGLSGIIPYAGLGERRDMYPERRDPGRELRLDEDHQRIDRLRLVTELVQPLVDDSVGR